MRQRATTRTLLVAAAVTTLTLAVAPPASAAPVERNCGSVGRVVGDVTSTGAVTYESWGDCGTVSVRARYGRRTRTVKTIAVTSGHGFRTELRLPSARWSSAAVIARVAGNSRYLTVEKRRRVRR